MRIVLSQIIIESVVLSKLLNMFIVKMNNSIVKCIFIVEYFCLFIQKYLYKNVSLFQLPGLYGMLLSN